jgi:sugar phosphate permease
MAEMKKIFYGWYVVAACMVIAMWAGVIFYGMTAFINPMIQDLKWSYLAISLAASLRSAEMGFLAPVSGYLADRIGPRTVALLSGVTCGLGFLLLSTVNTLTMFYVSFFILSIGFSGLGHAVVSTAVANWFKRNLSKAMGLAITGYGLSGIFLPGVVKIISVFQWRTAFVILGVVSWVITIPASLLLRHRPEQYGYTVDGDKTKTPADTAAGQESAISEQDITLAGALRSRAFWCLSLSMCFFFGVVNAVTLHAIPYLLKINLSQSTAAIIAMFIPLASIPGRLLFGWLGDIMPKRTAMGLGYGGVAVGLLVFYLAESPWHFVVFLVFFGLGFGGCLPIRVGLIRDYFGRKHFGTIHGVSLSIMTIGAVVGPALVGWIVDFTGSYEAAWLTCFWASVASLPLTLALPKNPDYLRTPLAGARG